MNIKIAKIGDYQIDNNTISVKYYYEMPQQDRVTISKQPNYIIIDKLDVVIMKQFLSTMIEVLHWSANYGIYMDANQENAKQLNDDPLLIIYLPTFEQIANYLRSTTPSITFIKMIEYRRTLFEQHTTIFLRKIAGQLITNLKETDEDKKLYNLIIEQPRSADSLIITEYIAKRIFRNSVKQSLIIYNMSDDALVHFKKHHDREKQILLDKQKNKTSNTQQSENLINFLNGFHVLQTRQDIITTFGLKLRQENNTLDFRQFCQANIKQEGTPVYKESIDIAIIHETIKKILQPSTQQIQPQQEQKPQPPQPSGLCQFVVSSTVNKNNLIFPWINASSQPDPTSNGANKILNIQFKSELLESKLCYIFKTQIPEIQFTIDTADDLMYLGNLIQRENGETSFFIDEQRKLTMYSSIVLGQNVNILAATLKVIDMHTIYFYMLLDFHQKNIAYGKSIKESRYLALVKEIMHNLLDYENDFKDFLNRILSDKMTMRELYF